MTKEEVKLLKSRAMGKKWFWTRTNWRRRHASRKYSLVSSGWLVGGWHSVSSMKCRKREFKCKAKETFTIFLLISAETLSDGNDYHLFTQKSTYFSESAQLCLNSQETFFLQRPRLSNALRRVFANMLDQPCATDFSVLYFLSSHNTCTPSALSLLELNSAKSPSKGDGKDSRNCSLIKDRTSLQESRKKHEISIALFRIRDLFSNCESLLT